MDNSIDISGHWAYRLDPNNQGLLEHWFEKSWDTSLLLPGSLDENGIGEPYVSPLILDGLARKVTYTGRVWLSKIITIPNSWVGKSLSLHLERVHWFSDLWVNSCHVGGCDSLSVPHQYVIPEGLATSQIRIALCVDNTIRIPVGKIGHALTDWTQTNWNGVIGQMTLSPIQNDLDSLKVQVKGSQAIVSGVINRSGDLKVSVGDLVQTITVSAGDRIEEGLSLEGLEPWSDQSPALHDLSMELGDLKSIRTIGYRRFEAVGKLFHLNRNPTFLRGTLDCCVFPKTGYPPMAAEPWTQIFEKIRSFGLNHVRFHSWCPPEAAFIAADRLGMILQVELPVWTGLWPVSSDEDLLDFCGREARRILTAYGEHPSFALFGLGNEIAFYGEEPAIDRLLSELKSEYPNQLFNFSAHGTHLSNESNYFVQADNGKPGSENRPLRGSTWFGVGSRFDRELPSSVSTVQEAADQFDKPVISHEVGEWAVFPDVHHADRYDGVLKASNFEEINRMLGVRGMADQAPSFVNASGKLSAELYKEEIETLLRTSGLAGYQLLGLSDFPGQGTATIGMLDAFWQEKGFIGAEEFKRFCADTVPLLKLPRMVWQPGEVLQAKVEVHRSGATVAEDCYWTAELSDGSVLTRGNLGRYTLQAGSNSEIGEITLPLSEELRGEKIRLTVSVGEDATNVWNVWVLGGPVDDRQAPSTRVFTYYRNDVRQALLNGEAVWLKLNPNRLWGGLPGRFASAFWSPVHFKEQVGTMGTLIHDAHPLFQNFPTESYTEWHWWDILTRSKALSVNALPSTYRPLVQVIDRYERNDKLATIWEAKVGPGKLFVSAVDFEDVRERPAAKHLYGAICKYLDHSTFSPDQEISIQELDRVFFREP